MRKRTCRLGYCVSSSLLCHSDILLAVWKADHIPNALWTLSSGKWSSMSCSSSLSIWNLEKETKSMKATASCSVFVPSSSSAIENNQTKRILMGLVLNCSSKTSSQSNLITIPEDNHNKNETGPKYSPDFLGNFIGIVCKKKEGTSPMYKKYGFEWRGKQGVVDQPQRTMK